jgi:predicted nucleic acid-binding protein
VQSVTLDSNIFISAFVFRGEPLRLLQMAQNGLIRLDVSDTILNEFGRVLHGKFEWSAEDVKVVQAKILGFANHVTPVEAVHVMEADADNDAILECAGGGAVRLSGHGRQAPAKARVVSRDAHHQASGVSGAGT